MIVWTIANIKRQEGVHSRLVSWLYHINNWLMSISLRIRILLIFGPPNPHTLKKKWNPNTFQNPYESIYGLESEYISFFAIEYEYNNPWRDMDLRKKCELIWIVVHLRPNLSNFHKCPLHSINKKESISLM